MTRRRVRQPDPPAPGAVALKLSTSALHPDVWKIGEGGDARVLKTFRRSPAWARATVGRAIARREARNLKALAGLPGLPQFLRRPEPWSVEMTWLDAEHLPVEKKTMEPEWFDRLGELLREMHRRGLNYGDLRRQNLMRSRADGSPCLVDFAQCMYAPNPRSLFHRVVMRRAFEVDDATLLKLRKWYVGGKRLTPEERARAHQVPRHLKVGQFLKKSVYAPLMRALGMKKRRRG